METRIREYTVADKEACMAAFKSNVPKYFTNEEVSDFENFLIKVGKGLKGTKFYVVEYGQKVIGCGGFGDKENTGIITLAWGLVHRDFHKQGFGEKLLSYRLEKIAALGLKSPVFVDTSQYSEGLSKKFVFRTKKVVQDYYARGV